MKKNLIYVLISFLSVALIISVGTNIAYRTNVITDLKDDFQKQHLEKDADIARLEEELEIARSKQTEAENKLKEKLAEEEKLKLEEEQRIKNAQIATQQKAAEEARLAAEAAAAKEVSKKSKAS